MNLLNLTGFQYIKSRRDVMIVEDVMIAENIFKTFKTLKG